MRIKQCHVVRLAAVRYFRLGVIFQSGICSLYALSKLSIGVLRLIRNIKHNTSECYDKKNF